MSLDTIKKVSEEEQKANSRIEAARSEAEQLVSQANASGENLLKQGYADGKQYSKKLITDVEEKAQDATREILKLSETQCETMREAAKQHLPKARAFIVGKVVGN